ncbi:hypothetical protein EHI8A_045380 [Entamoeba histolytica HM-1:IMSS-B]|uniref:Actin n=6 Tax=Entamoeba histolytica TaxID=5759 RepID=C4LWQ3_ENTH1|nr:hypothetical protein EHI_198570 [Entamoeba histolytica HM-1:IMSS]EMD43056.1 Hypothetical protein EHI5A_079820 [Entamoeba histolytica KU27]EMH73008.1 hypothetical protein EHI8A_045380 [Entamoeba histolytica HM-1:IMSS-B]EMS11272.1 hypothetical protein KM1_090820 [Entamoeba histolytica HM-3:IMSS]ENY65037.1 hypothetical protein EHI7A_046020 [Entamoeba histolytica HM-1:IMSS-A]GAT93143.1 hypothetical protein CL6EHI_198570 [Entamoeba histolytica]|eukprot:XP_655196.1 hypothetical protein EHI_198570 [Entamoeba histolytica HM-1:IMSS]
MEALNENESQLTGRKTEVSVTFDTPKTSVSLTPNVSNVYEESSRKTEELIEETPENSPILKRQKNIVANTRQQSGYFFFTSTEEKQESQDLDFTTYTGAKDLLTIVDGCKVIIDIGTYSMKVGLITDDSPRRRLPMAITEMNCCEEAVKSDECEFILEPYHINPFQDSQLFEDKLKRILNEIYRVVLRGCNPSSHPIYFSVNQHLINIVDSIRGCFTQLGVNEIEYVNPFYELLLPTQSSTGLILDFGSAISLKAIIENKVIEQMEIDNKLIDTSKILLQQQLHIQPSKWDTLSALKFSFCSEKFNLHKFVIQNNEVEWNDDIKQMLEDSLFEDSSLINLFLEVLKNCPRTSRRNLISHIIVVGGLVLDGIEERLIKELKQVASQFHVQSRDFKIIHHNHSYNAQWEATQQYVKDNYNI